MRYLLAYLGWRKFMEDASLYVSPFTYKNYSLFGVFDGHGGKLKAIFRSISSPVCEKALYELTLKK